MEIISVKNLGIQGVKTIRFARFSDSRGYFTEHFRKSDFEKHPELSFLKNSEIVQAGQSKSKKDVVRGLHFQWNPLMGKLVRTISGRMVDMMLDIRKESPTHGKIILQDMPASESADFDEWLWVPQGIAHGNFFTETTLLEYFFTAEHNPACEATISPLAKDIDWSICDSNLKKLFDEIISRTQLMTDKDRKGFTLKEWQENKKSDNLTYSTI